MPDISTLHAIQTLPDDLLETSTIKELADKAGLTPIEAKLVPTVCGAILHAIRHNNTSLRFALGVEAKDDYKSINLDQLDLVINDSSLRDEIVCSNGAIEACQKLIKHFRLIWLDYGTTHYYCQRMELNIDVISKVMQVVHPIGLALEQDDDEILDPLRAQLGKPLLRDVLGGHIIINHVMLDRILNDPNGEMLRRKLVGGPIGIQKQGDLHTTRAFLIRLQREMS